MKVTMLHLEGGKMLPVLDTPQVIRERAITACARAESPGLILLIMPAGGDGTQVEDVLVAARKIQAAVITEVAVGPQPKIHVPT